MQARVRQKDDGLGRRTPWRHKSNRQSFVTKHGRATHTWLPERRTPARSTLSFLSVHDAAALDVRGHAGNLTWQRRFSSLRRLARFRFSAAPSFPDRWSYQDSIKECRWQCSLSSLPYLTVTSAEIYFPGDAFRYNLPIANKSHW